MTGWEIVVIALACFRVTRLIGWDEITTPARAWVCGMGDKRYHSLAKWVESVRDDGRDPWSLGQDDLVPPISKRRYYLAKLIHCPWCVGWWISAAAAALSWAWWFDLAWWHAALLAFAWSASVGLLAKNLDP